MASKHEANISQTKDSQPEGRRPRGSGLGPSVGHDHLDGLRDPEAKTCWLPASACPSSSSTTAPTDDFSGSLGQVWAAAMAAAAETASDRPDLAACCTTSSSSPRTRPALSRSQSGPPGRPHPNAASGPRSEVACGRLDRNDPTRKLSFPKQSKIIVSYEPKL